MENVSWPDIAGNTNAPYINNVLLAQCSYATNMFTIAGTSGSLPQYIYLEAGTNFGINDSSDPAMHHVASTNHLVIQLQNAGRTWKAYEESISGTSCPTASSGLYAAFHNQFVYFDDIYLNSTNCTNHIRPYTELASDLTNNTFANYNFITPNLCDDMHGNAACPPGDRILLGDRWLSNEIPKILASQAYSNKGAIIITWDEGTSGASGPFATLVLSQFAKGGGYRMTNRVDHKATFRTLQEIFHVPLLYTASNTISLSDLFKPTIQVSPPSLTTNKLFQFTVTGLVSNKSNIFQFTTNFPSTNPVTWVNLFTNVVATNRFIFIDTNSSNAPRRFYRVLESY
jgi:hypothetical protein